MNLGIVKTYCQYLKTFVLQPYYVQIKRGGAFALYFISSMDQTQAEMEISITVLNPLCNLTISSMLFLSPRQYFLYFVFDTRYFGEKNEQMYKKIKWYNTHLTSLNQLLKKRIQKNDISSHLGFPFIWELKWLDP